MCRRCLPRPHLAALPGGPASSSLVRTRVTLHPPRGLVLPLQRPVSGQSPGVRAPRPGSARARGDQAHAGQRRVLGARNAGPEFLLRGSRAREQSRSAGGAPLAHGPRGGRGTQLTGSPCRGEGWVWDVQHSLRGRHPEMAPGPARGHRASQEGRRGHHRPGRHCRPHPVTRRGRTRGAAMRQRVSGGWRAGVRTLAPRRGCRGPHHSKASRPQGAGGQWGDGSAGVAWPEPERPNTAGSFLPLPGRGRGKDITPCDSGRTCWGPHGAGAVTPAPQREELRPGVLSPLRARPHPRGAGACALYRSPSVSRDSTSLRSGACTGGAQDPAAGLPRRGSRGTSCARRLQGRLSVYGPLFPGARRGLGMRGALSARCALSRMEAAFSEK